jgi:hypothetical protein
MLIDEKDYLAHYGILRRSGRYPWGSGGPEYASNRSFLGMVDGLKKQGMKETEIADFLGATTSELRAAKSIARNQEKQAQIDHATALKEKGLSNSAIGRAMGGLNESSVRSLLAPGAKDKAAILEATSNLLKEQVAAKKYIDIGAGVEQHLDLTNTKLNTAVARLKEEGYEVHYIKVEQLGTGKNTTVTVLAAPGTTQKEVWENRDQIKQIASYSEDGGRSYLGIDPPLNVSSKRVHVRYADQGGTEADGVIYVRPGVHDLSLGQSPYAQVRIAIDGTHYLKGMAMYKDDLPDGVDLVFNTNKKDTGNKLDSMKPLKDDPDNPFGSVVRQIKDSQGSVSSAMNIVNDEGDWDRWSRTLSSQMLSKQSPTLAKTQLNMTYERKKAELDEIMSYSNPAVRKRLLDAFADDADSSAVHLKAAALPRQKTHVILPINSMKETEIYAPGYNNGERVVLIRHPHGGTFEIPELVVNNRNQEARKILGNAKVAVGIHSKVAARLSGADFDGDTVLVIPNNNRSVKTTPALEGLKGFDPQHSYPAYEGMKPMDARTKAVEMGHISNLITDMTIQGASTSELAQAVRHSMVVIDAEKHNLDWKQSEINNGIAKLKIKYQGRSTAGASTLISRAKSRLDVPKRIPRPAAKGGPVDVATGKKVFVNTGEGFTNRQGKFVVRKERSTKLAEAQDAHSLSSGTVIEKVYADHSNKMKDLANQARRASVTTRATSYSPASKTAYQKEVTSLNAKLNIALRNAPLERQAQLIANAIVTQKRAADPNMEASELKKIKGLALNAARARTGAGKTRIVITDSEWAAIQAGAISNSKLNQILNNADLETVKKLATPKAENMMTETKKIRASAMLASGYTRAEVATALGVSVSTLSRSVSG